VLPCSLLSSVCCVSVLRRCVCCVCSVCAVPVVFVCAVSVLLRRPARPLLLLSTALARLLALTATSYSRRRNCSKTRQSLIVPVFSHSHLVVALTGRGREADGAALNVKLNKLKCVGGSLDQCTLRV
jgi:hypothetical protein